MAFVDSLGIGMAGKDELDIEMAKEFDSALCLNGPLTFPPCVRDVSSFVSNSLQGTKMQMLKGTTTLGFVYEAATNEDKGGIILAVDSRASSGEYISSSTVMKILPITKRIAGTMAGGAADCQFWLRVLSKTCQLYEMRTKSKITACAASKMLQNILHNYKGMGIVMGNIVAGPNEEGMGLYMVNSEGVRKEGKIFSTGSGSLNAYGIMDTFYRQKMTDVQAKELGVMAIMHATLRDIGSGGWVTVCHITRDGFTLSERQDVSELAYDHMLEKHSDLYEPHL